MAALFSIMSFSSGYCFKKFVLKIASIWSYIYNTIPTRK
ncbi:hypothetical protein RAMDARK_1445 [Rickettsia amblyommatis str. Darkwater]|nr:hypothetical protein RAMDARK_1445 [Rickettsia amblyommatis str. Darkwater]